MPVRKSPQAELGNPVHRPPGPLLEVCGLTAGYGDAPAVRDLYLTVWPGEIVALFGPNGAGKTTTLLACVNVLPPMAGTIEWHGRTARRPLHKLVQERVSLVPEGRSVISKLSVRDNLRLGQGGVPPALALFPELEPHLSRPAGLLSGGQQQMLAVARALAAQPRVLLVDELSLGLAPQIVDRLLAAITEAVRTRDLGVLLVEQQAHRAFDIADRWYLLHNGRSTATGSTGDGITALETAYLAGLHGTNPSSQPSPA